MKFDIDPLRLAPNEDNRPLFEAFELIGDALAATRTDEDGRARNPFGDTEIRSALHLIAECIVSATELAIANRHFLAEKECPMCKGRGRIEGEAGEGLRSLPWVDGDSPDECPKCGGSGRVR